MEATGVHPVKDLELLTRWAAYVLVLIEITIYVLLNNHYDRLKAL